MWDMERLSGVDMCDKIDDIKVFGAGCVYTRVMDACVCGNTHPWAAYDWDGGEASVARGIAYYEYYKRWRIENAYPLFLPIAPSVGVDVSLTQICPCMEEGGGGGGEVDGQAPTGGVLDAPASVKGGVLYVREYLQFMLDFYRRRQAAMDDDRTYGAEYMDAVNEEVESMSADMKRVYALELDATDVKASWEEDSMLGSLSRLAYAEDQEARRRMPADVYARVFQYGDDWTKRRCAAGMVCEDDVSGRKAARSNGAAIYEMTKFMADYKKKERQLERKRATDRARRVRERDIQDAKDEADVAAEEAEWAAAEAAGEVYASEDDDPETKRRRQDERRYRARRIQERNRRDAEQHRLVAAAMSAGPPDEEDDSLMVQPRARFAAAMDSGARARFEGNGVTYPAKFEFGASGDTSPLFKMSTFRIPAFNEIGS